MGREIHVGNREPNILLAGASVNGHDSSDDSPKSPRQSAGAFCARQYTGTGTTRYLLCPAARSTITTKRTRHSSQPPFQRVVSYRKSQPHSRREPLFARGGPSLLPQHAAKRFESPKDSPHSCIPSSTIRELRRDRFQIEGSSLMLKSLSEQYSRRAREFSDSVALLGGHNSVGPEVLKLFRKIKRQRELCRDAEQN